MICYNNTCCGVFFSSQWLQERYRNWYTQEARRRELRSRAWFKLDAINCMDKLFSTGMMVVDLGAAPGGWSLYAKKKVGDTGRVIACDVLPIRKIFGVDFLQGDCSDSDILQKLLTWVGESQRVQVVLSDMSPNITGVSVIDSSRSICLGNVALGICYSVLMVGGTFLVKVFQGQDLDEYLCNVRSLFKIVKIRKPRASYAHSREVYIVAKGYKS